MSGACGLRRTPRSVREPCHCCTPRGRGVHQPVRAGAARCGLSGTEATNSDVGMSRGPRKISALSSDQQEQTRPLIGNQRVLLLSHPAAISCGDSPKPDRTPQALRAISARIRCNEWHYLPHGSGMHHRAAERDWFFAPTMSDADRLVRPAPPATSRTGCATPSACPASSSRGESSRSARLPTDAGLGWRGLYDRGPAQRDRHRRATAGLLPGHADHLASGAPALDVVDFDNSWYQARYNDPTKLILKEEAHG